ncbi:hypothetical protein [Nocardia miyunensis]|uniref:hypothetical protein n=1 Tax=Nocardia miyunensis TaxID=282684 RepID=UPI0008302C5D|nr:hypothetical protein [Nocardia miyunensis]
MLRSGLDRHALRALRSGAARRSVRRPSRSRSSSCARVCRPHAVYRKFGLCRVCLREMAHRGELPGVHKSSW